MNRSGNWRKVQAGYVIKQQTLYSKDDEYPYRCCMGFTNGLLGAHDSFAKEQCPVGLFGRVKQLRSSNG